MALHNVTIIRDVTIGIRDISGNYNGFVRDETGTIIINKFNTYFVCESHHEGVLEGTTEFKVFDGFDNESIITALKEGISQHTETLTVWCEGMRERENELATIGYYLGGL